jgi:outer membrane beta-barrel protein
MSLRVRAALAFCALFLSTAAPAQQSVVENVAVRNRLYRVANRLELSAAVGFGLARELTEHVNLSLGAAYNVTDTWAFEIRAGYAISGHTNIARQLSRNFLQFDPNQRNRIADDLSALWEMKANGQVGVRWAPIYGKISLLAEIPVHFQVQFWAGGGVGQFHRESVVYCRQLISRSDGTCGDWLSEDTVRPMGSVAAALRFFSHRSGSFKLELRDYIFRDSYLTSIDRVIAERGEPTGVPSNSPGIIQLFTLELGYAVFF